MQKLHLVGITPDHKGLVLSEYARAKRGELTLDIDDTLLAAIEEARRLRARDEGKNLRSAALPTRRDEPAGDGKAGSSLSPKEIQARLRMGHSVTAVAREAGVTEGWIERFAPPVVAEQAQMVEKAKGLVLAKRGAGPSAEPLGRAVLANVVERGVPASLSELDSAWRAYQRDDGTWAITFSFVQRGRRQTAEWILTGVELTARNRLAAELGHRDKRSAATVPVPPPDKKSKKRPLEATRAKPKPQAKSPARKPASKPAAAKPAAAKPAAAKPAAPKPAAPEPVAPVPELPKAEAPMAPEATPQAKPALEPKPVAALIKEPPSPITAAVASDPAPVPAPRAKKAPARKPPAKKPAAAEPAPAPPPTPQTSLPGDPEPEPKPAAGEPEPKGQAQVELDLTTESTEPATRTT
jgi:hypothetical protein